MTICALKSCGSEIEADSDNHVDIHAKFSSKNASNLQKMKIAWSRSGDATFHEACWKMILSSSRAVKKQNIQIPLSLVEKQLVKQAAKSAECFCSLQNIKQKAEEAVQMIKKSKHGIIFSGAGISTASGIGDFRGKHGKWTDMDNESIPLDNEVGEPSAKREKLDEVDEVLDEDNVPYEALRPTYSHEAIVKLMELGYIKYVITQNCDGLHTLAGVHAGQISELHGCVFTEVCSRCQTRYQRNFYVMDDRASEYWEEIQESGHTDLVKPKHATQCKLCELTHRTGRTCSVKNKLGKVCSGPLEDTIINFCDNLEEDILNRAEEHADRCDLVLCLGTTLKVTPACDLVTRNPDANIILCNRQSTSLDKSIERAKPDDIHGIRIFGDCDVFMREVMKQIMSSEALKKWHDYVTMRTDEYDAQRK